MSLRTPGPAVVAATLACLPALAQAVEVLECGDWVGAETLVEPWEKTTRTFSRGSVRVALVDLGEPECCPQHFAILIPANMYGGRACFLVARSKLLPNGWVKVGLDEASSMRDDVPGLKVSVPVYGVEPLTGAADPGNRQVISLRVRQAAGTVDLEDTQ